MRLPPASGWIFLGIAFGVPAALAHFVVGAPWLQAGCALAVWYLALWLLLGGPANSRGESLGWTMIMGMFFSWIAVPLVALALRLFDLPYRFM